ncbi:MAG: PAS domain S-box protein, partial [Thermoguttaceae bacterium]
AIEGISPEPDLSMAGFAMNAANVVHSDDIVAERRFTDLLLRRLHMGSGIFAALCAHNRAFGALGIVRRQPGPFASEHSRFTMAIAQLMASYLGQNAAELQLQRREAVLEAVLGSVQTLVLRLDGQGIVLEMNAAAIRTSGFHTRELRDRPFWNTLIVPADSQNAAEIFRRGNRPGTLATFEAGLLSKEGEQRTVQWSLGAVQADEASPATYLLTGEDRTELVECAKELQKSRKIARGAAKAAGQGQVAGDRKRAEPQASAADQRSSPRREYTYYQRIAPILGTSLPTDDEFRKVACCDISAGGLSYILDDPPAYHEVLISLGTPPADRKVIARVVRVVEKEVSGRIMYQVGCRFVGRVGD